MYRTRSVTALISALLCLASSGLSAQGTPLEIDEIHRRVAAIESQLPAITALAEKYTAFLGKEGSGRFLISRSIDPAFFLEFLTRAGGPPDTQDPDASTTSGLVLLPVRHWDGNGLGVATKVDQMRAQARPVLLIGPMQGRPEAMLQGAPMIDDGAPTGARANASINGIANMIAAWTFYSEVVSAATRAGWQPGILLSVLMTGATDNNSRSRFRMPGAAPNPIRGGVLGAQYLHDVDSILALAASPEHRTLVDTVAARMRALRQQGHTIFAGSCGHYLMEEIPHDALSSKTFAVLPEARRGDAPSGLLPTRGDGMIWFGYGGYDCPNADVSTSFRELGLKVVVVTDRPPEMMFDNVLAQVRLPWQLPDGVIPLPFPPGRVAPVSSVDMAIHYLWFRRLLASP